AAGGRDAADDRPLLGLGLGFRDREPAHDLDVGIEDLDDRPLDRGVRELLLLLGGLILEARDLGIELGHLGLLLVELGLLVVELTLAVGERLLLGLQLVGELLQFGRLRLIGLRLLLLEVGLFGRQLLALGL